ncbi:MAG: glycosyltransferase [Methylobacterium frigidaeris]
MPSPQPLPRASVVIPTLDRPAALARALASAAGQAGLGPGAFEVVVVDNSPDANARAAVAALAAGSAVPVRYVSEPRPGVSNARNAGVAAARGGWIAFLDDDEEAGPDWLSRLLATAETSGAGAVFGPVRAVAESGAELGPFARYFTREIEAATGTDITARSACLGTNNSLFSKARCLSDPSPFAEGLNSFGGEDSLLLKRLVRRGCRLAWCGEAVVTEWVPPRRLTWDYVRRRKFLSGQIRSFVLAMLDPPQAGSVALWMGVGGVQFALFSIAALAARPVSPTRAEHWRATARGGLGKVLWMRRFRPRLYGTGHVS